MKEKDIQKIFGNINNKFGVFELKLAKGNSIPFNSVADHQIEALTKVSTGEGLYHKISDSPVSWQTTMRFTKPKPFDCFRLRFTPAYVVVCWYVPNEKKIFHYIAIKDFLAEKKRATRKSLTKERSKEIASFIL